MRTLERHKFQLFAAIVITGILGAMLSWDSEKSRLVLLSSDDIHDDIHPSIAGNPTSRMQSLSESKITTDMLLKAAHDLEKAGTIETTASS